MRFALAIVLMSAGCASTQYDAQRSEITSQADRSAVYEECNIFTPPGADCGLIAPEFWGNAFVTQFISEICGGEADDACETRLVRAWIERLSARYPNADLADVSRYCDTYPRKCADNSAFERLWLRSHNSAVDAQEALALGQVASAERQQDAEAAASRQRALDGLRDVLLDLAKSKQGTSIDCTTHGSTTHCTSRSAP